MLDLSVLLLVLILPVRPMSVGILIANRWVETVNLIFPVPSHPCSNLRHNLYAGLFHDFLVR